MYVCTYACIRIHVPVNNRIFRSMFMYRASIASAHTSPHNNDYYFIYIYNVCIATQTVLAYTSIIHFIRIKYTLTILLISLGFVIIHSLQNRMQKVNALILWGVTFLSAFSHSVKG